MIFQNIWNKNKIILNGKSYKFKKMDLEETISFLFLLLPYIRFTRDIKGLYIDDEKDNFSFGILVKELIDHVKEDDLEKALQIIFHTTDKNISVAEYLDYLPYVIRENRLIDLYYLLKGLKVFE